jgi:predicted DNA-binding protein YlxM (UPF0122 family)
MDSDFSPQSKRLKAFIDTTGMSLTEFGKQCKIPSTSSIHNVVSLGKTPSTKLLDKIITRFPQLNHDWVLLGYGEMIVQGMQRQPANANSVTKSRDASYENIQDFLENHDYSLNELANKVQKAMLSAEKTYRNVNDRLDNFEDRLSMLEKNQNNIANSVYSRLDGLWDKYVIKINDDLIQFNEVIQDLKTALTKTSNENTKKAMDFVHSLKLDTDKEVTQKILGEFVKHSNPKPEK